ncbi:Zinc finger PHD-type protein [Lasiodiplodia theobromae]|uniref:Putative histone deacetylase complex subunit cti6 n=1 Tax=Lasiodiplodia theobromae TaxID=45133 RepID=A0A5N5DQ99_9PEZI|nr:Zinc finger PHD-type protein [Lasiodiplodia theobromae]KAB2580138.1 putative histone deacetylase complex subunit cti6 [Lasiodiplodia theobromae]KAF4542696.1 Zinc finger PHD-type protein [Lasiodiplodia theobromae]
MTLRRSSRAPPPAHSNSSSSLSSRDRTTRSNNKASSPRKSDSPGSLSSDDGDDTGRTRHSEELQTRRRTRAQDIEEEEAAKMDEELDEEVGDDEEETTRCICGYQEYPGPPSDDEDLAVGSDLQAEDVGGLFIQCDKCKVWQHGGCVGIMEEKSVPENYFCEECRKDLHNLLASPKGQKYSHYIPVVGNKVPSKHSARKSSVSKEAESRNSRDKDKASRSSVEAFTKRRSTMNSRAAYDDDEVLRQVLEDSKGEGGTATSENGTRKGKRVRDESEDVKQGIKRQRTGSGSSSSPAPSEGLDSDDDGRSKSNSASQKQKPRGAAARSQQERIAREQKEKERERAEAAGKRKGRADRRRGEDMETETTARETPNESEQQENEPPANQTRETPTAPAPNAKRPGKSGGQKRGGNRVGRNQYTRDRDLNSVDKAPGSPGRNGVRNHKDKDEEGSPVNGTDTAANGSGSDVPAVGRPTKNGKKMGVSKLDKISWKDMNGTASHMLEYISRVQVEMASEKTTTTTSAIAVVKTLQVINGTTTDKLAPTDGSNGLAKPTDGKEENYDTLNSLEMMDVLTRNLVLWQQKFGEHRDK